jgi:hypothetical protein
MESQSPEIDLEKRIQQLEARNRRLEQMGLLALALLLVMSFFLVRQQWSSFSETGKPVAFLLDANRKPEAVVQVTSSGQVRLVSLRPDGSLPRLMFASQSGGVAKASATPATSSSTAHSCNLTNPASSSLQASLMVSQEPKKEEGEASSTHEERSADGSRVKTVLFKNLLLDRIYPSMTGPRKTHRIVLGNADDKKVWVTGFRAEVLDGQNNAASQQFMCHTALDVVGRDGTGAANYRGQAFTVSQGQTAIEFPRGFAMPVPNASDMQQDLLVQVLNNNEPKIHRELNFRTTLRYFGDHDAHQRKLIPLKLTGGSVSPLLDLVRPVGREEVFAMPDGKLSTIHWLVPPGRQVTSTEIALNLAHDTTVHYIWMHVHPYAESVELRDKTANQTVWKGSVRNDPDPKRAEVLATDTYSSPNGIALHHDHRYEVIATYDNPTPRNVDAMASLWMYVRADGE